MMGNWAITSLLQFSFGCNYNKHNLSSSLIYYSTSLLYCVKRVDECSMMVCEQTFAVQRFLLLSGSLPIPHVLLDEIVKL